MLPIILLVITALIAPSASPSLPAHNRNQHNVRIIIYSMGAPAARSRRGGAGGPAPVPRAARSRPKTSIRPAAPACMPRRQRSRVVLPAPLGTQQPDHLPAAHVEGLHVENPPPARPDREPGTMDHRMAHGRAASTRHGRRPPGGRRRRPALRRGPESCPAPPRGRPTAPPGRPPVAGPRGRWRSPASLGPAGLASGPRQPGLSRRCRPRQTCPPGRSPNHRQNASWCTLVKTGRPATAASLSRQRRTVCSMRRSTRASAAAAASGSSRLEAVIARAVWRQADR